MWTVELAVALQYLEPVHMGSQVLSPQSLEVNPCNLNSWKHGSWDFTTSHGSQVLGPKYDMDASMTTLLEMTHAWDLCWESDRAKS